MAPGTPSSKSDLLLLASLFSFELSITVMVMAMYMKGDRAFTAFLPSNPGMVFLVAIAVVLIAGAVIINRYLACRRSAARHFRLIVMMNLVTVLLILVIGEIAVRVGSRSSPEGAKFGNRVLKPKNWGQFALHNRQLIDRAGGDLSYFVHDDVLGWTVGPNRRSNNGLYYSSSEGMRAPLQGVSFPRLTGTTRVALVGDSFTFGEEVAYEDTWGFLLEEALGSEFQVLNFGVPGYGVDQAYLRYEKDARRWNPKIVVFGLFSHDLLRSMTVYPFLAHPEWDMPFSKPRFILRDGKIERLKALPLPYEDIYSRGSIFELPFLELDAGFKQSDWQESFYHHSYLARLFVSRFPRWSDVAPDLSDEALVSVNASLLKAFVQSAAQAGTIPIVVYLPKRIELENPSSPPPDVKRVLQEGGIVYTDPTSCLLEVNPADRYMSGGHYTPQGNAAVAKCLRSVVSQALAQVS